MFGNPTASTGSISNPFRYTGREFDAETGLYFYRARYYDPSIARFISEDPIGLLGGINQYVYAQNDPINSFDSFGLKAQKCESPCDSALFGYAPLFSAMANKLDTKSEFLMALALQESGWGLSHVFGTNSLSNGEPLNNLFGITNAGGNNLPFDSVEASGDCFIKGWGPSLSDNPQTIEGFVSDLLKDPNHMWNEHANYPVSILGGVYPETDRAAGIEKGDRTIGTYQSVLKWLKKCGKKI